MKGISPYITTISVDPALGHPLAVIAKAIAAAIVIPDDSVMRIINLAKIAQAVQDIYSDMPDFIALFDKDDRAALETAVRKLEEGTCSSS